MTILFNATLHPQTASDFAEFGFSFAGGDTSGHGNRAVPVEASFTTIAQAAVALCLQAKEAGAEALLVGGMSSVSIALFLAATGAKLRVFEAKTERLRDENDRFVFKLRGLREIHT